MSARATAALLLICAAHSLACSQGQAADPSWTPQVGEPQGQRSMCPHDLPASCPTPPPSYARDIQPILATRCLGCHGDGGVAQSIHDYTTYAGVLANRSAILDQVYVCAMPPPNAGAPTTGERQKLLAWLVCGAPDD